MTQPQTIEELLSSIPTDLINTIEIIDTNEKQTCDFLSFDDDDSSTIDIPVATFKSHCFSRSFLYYCSAYKKMTKTGKVALLNGCIMFDFGMKKTIRVSVIHQLQDEVRDNKLIDYLRQFGYVRSGIVLSPADGKKGKEVNEVVHDLDAVFDPASYANAKKRNQRLGQPLRVLVDNNVELRKLTIDDFPMIKEFCTRWHEMKLEDPKIFAMLFSNPASHFKFALEDDKFGEVWGYFIGDTMINLQLFGIDGENAFSLYNVTVRDEVDPRINAACYVHIMQHLRERGVGFFNVGIELNKKLAAFKHHYPHTDVPFYHYGAIKNKK